MFRVLDHHADGSLHVTNNVSGDASAIAMPPAGTVRWIDLQQPDATALFLDGDNFHLHNITYTQCQVTRNLAAMQKTILLHPNIHKCAEVHHVAYRTAQLHPRCQVIHRQHITPQNRWRLW